MENALTVNGVLYQIRKLLGHGKGGYEGCQTACRR